MSNTVGISLLKALVPAAGKRAQTTACLMVVCGFIAAEYASRRQLSPAFVTAAGLAFIGGVTAYVLGAGALSLKMPSSS